MRCEVCGFDGAELKKIGHNKNAENFKKGVEIAKLKSLLTRAADALEQFLSTNTESVLATPELRNDWEVANAKLITEVRKAAE